MKFAVPYDCRSDTLTWIVYVETEVGITHMMYLIFSTGNVTAQSKMYVG